MKFSIKDFFSKCDQIRCFQQILSHLLEKSLMENFIFCAVKFACFRKFTLIFLLKYFNMKWIKNNIEKKSVRARIISSKHTIIWYQ